MSIDVIEDLVVVYKGATPADLMASPIGVDVAYTIATILAMAEEEVSRLAAGASLGTATGLFLDQHGIDRGLRRQEDETDDQYRARLRNPPKAGTVSSIREAVEIIIDGEGFVVVIELPRGSAYYDREFCLDRGKRMGGGRGVVIVLIPASANAMNSVVDAVRSKVSAGKLFLVQEYTSGE